MTMKGLYILAVLAIVVSCPKTANTQANNAGTHFSLKQRITLPAGQNKIGGLAANSKAQRLYATMPKGKLIEEIDIQNGVIVQSRTYRFRPELICYLPELDEVFTTTSGGRCYFLSAKDLKRSNAIQLVGQPTVLLYDSVDRRIYVGYEDEDGLGCLITIDAYSHKKIAYLWLPGRPRDFQLDKKLDRLYVNVPAASEIDAIDLKENRVASRWRCNNPVDYLMAVDTLQHSLFLYSTKCSALSIMDTRTGRTKKSSIDFGKMDNFFFDDRSREFWLGTEENVYRFRGNLTDFNPSVSFRVKSNGLRTFIPSLRLYVAINAMEEQHKNDLLIYGLSNNKDD